MIELPRVPRRRAEVIIWCAILTPPALTAVFALLLGIGAPGMTTWFWPAPTTNIVEASWLNDAARVRTLVVRGESLDVRLPLRPRLLEPGAPPSMTPLEAAIRAEREDMVALLLELGARPTVMEAQRLQCVAIQMKLPRAAEYLGKTLKLPLLSCDP